MAAVQRASPAAAAALSVLQPPAVVEEVGSVDNMPD